MKTFSRYRRCRRRTRDGQRCVLTRNHDTDHALFQGKFDLWWFT